MSNIIIDNIQNVKSVAIAGHKRPDGDCVGSALALYNFLKTYYQDVQVDCYLGEFKDTFKILAGSDDIRCQEDDKTLVYDLFISLDCGDFGRIGCGSVFFESAKKTINIDHHISNEGFADIDYIDPKSSSTAEILYDLFGKETVTKQIAECIYVGMIHDTGVMRYSNTTPKTIGIIGALMETGIDFSTLIDKTFTSKTYTSHQLLGMALLESVRMMDNQVIFSVIKQRQLLFFDAQSKDVQGIIDQLRMTEGVEVAILLYEMGTLTYKVSMRSNGKVDVCKIATFFGGGGHIKAAGCTMQGQVHDIVNNITIHVERQLRD